MNYLISLFAVAGFLFAFAPTENKALENHKEGITGESVTVTGTLVDTKCYGEMPEANKGNDHLVMKDGQQMQMPNCATACANMGIPAALLTEAGILLTIVAPAAQLADHMEKQTRITGRLAADGVLLPDKIEVRDGRRWQEVAITFMM